MSSAFVIAIDGYSSCGKSTLANLLAQRLGFVHIDSGAMYRAITLFFLQQNILPEHQNTIAEKLSEIKIEYKIIDSSNQIFLNGKNVTEEIRNIEVTKVVSKFSENLSIRQFSTQLQQSYQQTAEGLVMDGRDIGTTVFPKAQIKFFITSNLNIRAQRRFVEVKKNNSSISLEEIKADLQKRDETDMNRQYSPLRKPDDAIVLENNFLSMDDLVAKALFFISKLI